MAHDSPEWLAHSIIYSVFPRNHGPQGGFAAVERDLERIQALGTDIVWLMPIHPIGVKGRKGSLGSPYAIKDYRGVNPELGTRAELESLIRRTHALGMKIMIDVVYNHTSPDSVLAAEHPEWFLRDQDGKPMPKFPEWWDIVDLRYYEPDGSRRQGLWDYQIESLRQWVELGIDGFRCDVASLVSAEFWLEARARIAEAFPARALLWLAETVHPSFIRFMRERGFGAWSDAEMLAAFDLSYDYDGQQILDRYLAGTASLQDYIDQVNFQAVGLPERGWKLRFTENHDVPRAAEKFRGAERLESWTAFQALLPGAFLAYAGQELAPTRCPSLFDADPIALPSGGQPAAFGDFLGKLLPLAKRIKTECRYAAVEQIVPGLVRIRWTARRDDDAAASPGKRYTAILNLEDRFGSFDPGRALTGTDQLSGETVELKAGSPIPRRPLIINEE
jgi:glycosidase